MTSTRRRFGPSAIAGLVALMALCTTAAHAEFPEQPIKLVVGFPPGGGGDLYGRLIATAMSKSIGQPVIVDNRAGAGGNIAADIVAKARPDGYTILLAMSGNLAVTPAIRPQSIAYKVPDDFAAIGLILEAPHGLFVAQNSRFKTARQLLDAARTEKLTFASTGTGAAAHIGMEIVKKEAGIEMLHIPYKGSGPAIADLLGGTVDSFFATASPLVGQVRQGQLRLLAITGNNRNAAIPDVPTFKELGLNVPVTQWYGLVAPAAVIGALLVFTLVNFGLLMTGMWLTRRPPQLRALLPDIDAFGSEVATLTLGIVTAEFLIHTPALTPVAVVLAAYLHRSSLVNSLHRAAAIDPKTTLPNLAAWTEHAQGVLERVHRRHEPVTVLFCDLDHFKEVNDTYGHLTGDRVLAAVAQCLRQELRGGRDDVGRFGGEEFVVVLHSVDHGEAHLIATRLRLAVSSLTFDHGLKITMSVGIAHHHPGSAPDLQKLLSRADAGLHAAKVNGRNQVRSA